MHRGKKAAAFDAGGSYWLTRPACFCSFLFFANSRKYNWREDAALRIDQALETAGIACAVEPLRSRDCMEIDLPALVAEVKAAFCRYDTALMTNDAATLQASFWQSKLTIRHGINENQRG